MTPSRFDSFAGEYVLAIAEAAKNLGMYRETAERVEDYALNTALSMLDRIQHKGIEAVQHYVINSYGGALRATCSALGLPNTSRALQDYLDGREVNGTAPGIPAPPAAA